MVSKKVTDKIKKKNYYLTGATQTALVYYNANFKGGIKSVGGTGLTLNENDFTYFYISKKSSLTAEDKWLKISVKGLKDRYESWKKKWQYFDEELFNLSTKPDQNWEKSWRRLDRISEMFWQESYFLDTLDPFAEDLETIVKGGLKKSRIDISLMHEMISPAPSTLPQQIVEDMLKVKNSGLDIKSATRRYWFKLGTWNGGKVLSEDAMKKEINVLVSKETLIPVLEKRRELQKNKDKMLDGKTRKLVELLRIFTLWREVRKSFLQRLSIGYNYVTDNLGLVMGINPEVSKWAMVDEVEDAVKNPQCFLNRKKESVCIYKSKDNNDTIITGGEASDIIMEFKQKSSLSSLKGTVASKGNLQGRVRIILREGEFHRFQENEILVTTMTRPEFVPLMRKAKAIITDEGGLTSHAAIISRELKKPCIIGTKVATQVLKDGDMVEVDANNGIVRILSGF